MNIRYNITFRKYPLRERLSLWFYNVRQAIRKAPPEKYAVLVPINPGEPGYEDAWFEMGIDQSPLRFSRPIDSAANEI